MFGGLLATLSISVAVAQEPSTQYSVLKRISGPAAHVPLKVKLAIEHMQHEFQSRPPMLTTHLSA